MSAGHTVNQSHTSETVVFLPFEVFVDITPQLDGQGA